MHHHSPLITISSTHSMESLDEVELDSTGSGNHLSSGSPFSSEEELISTILIEPTVAPHPTPRVLDFNDFSTTKPFLAVDSGDARQSFSGYPRVDTSSRSFHEDSSPYLRPSRSPLSAINRSLLASSAPPSVCPSPILGSSIVKGDVPIGLSFFNPNAANNNMSPPDASSETSFEDLLMNHQSLIKRFSHLYSLYSSLSVVHSSLLTKYQNLESNFRETQTSMSSLESEVNMLTTRLTDQVQLRTSAQLSRQEMAEELEELTQTLFEEANRLVAEERKHRSFCEEKVCKLEKELQDTKEELKREREQLSELKDKWSKDAYKAHHHRPRTLVGQPLRTRKGSRQEEDGALLELGLDNMSIGYSTDEKDLLPKDIDQIDESITPFEAFGLEGFTWNGLISGAVTKPFLGTSDLDISGTNSLLQLHLIAGISPWHSLPLGHMNGGYLLSKSSLDIESSMGGGSSLSYVYPYCLMPASYEEWRTLDLPVIPLSNIELMTKEYARPGITSEWRKKNNAEQSERIKLYNSKRQEVLIAINELKTKMDSSLIVSMNSDIENGTGHLATDRSVAARQKSCGALTRQLQENLSVLYSLDAMIAEESKNSNFAEREEFLVEKQQPLMLQLNPDWIVSSIDPHLFEEFLNWLGKRDLVENKEQDYRTKEGVLKNGQGTEKRWMSGSLSSPSLPTLVTSPSNTPGQCPTPPLATGNANGVGSIMKEAISSWSSSLLKNAKNGSNKHSKSTSALSALSSSPSAALTNERIDMPSSDVKEQQVKSQSVKKNKSPVSVEVSSEKENHDHLLFESFLHSSDVKSAQLPQSSAGDAFMKRAWEEDISPTLTFPLTSKQFTKKLVLAIGSNELCLERLSPGSLWTPSSAHASSAVSRPGGMASSSSSVVLPNASANRRASIVSTEPLKGWDDSETTTLSVSLPTSPLEDAVASQKRRGTVHSLPDLDRLSINLKNNKVDHEPQELVNDQKPAEFSMSLPTSPAGSMSGPSMKCTSKEPDNIRCGLCGRNIEPIPSLLAPHDDRWSDLVSDDHYSLEKYHSQYADLLMQLNFEIGSPRSPSSSMPFHHSSLLRSSLASGEGQTLLVHRLKISDHSHDLLICSHCRSKIVSVCNFFSFVRYYRAGFYGSASNEALWCRWCMLKRDMMMARLGMGPYFLINDITRFLNNWSSEVERWREYVEETWHEEPQRGRKNVAFGDALTDDHSSINGEGDNQSNLLELFKKRLSLRRAHGTTTYTVADTKEPIHCPSLTNAPTPSSTNIHASAPSISMASTHSTPDEVPQRDHNLASENIDTSLWNALAAHPVSTTSSTLSHILSVNTPAEPPVSRATPPVAEVSESDVAEPASDCAIVAARSAVIDHNLAESSRPTRSDKHQ